MSAIANVAWALQPGGSKRETRPAKLIDGLIRRGVVSQSPQYLFHGRSPSTGVYTSRGRWFPRVPHDASSTVCVLSPVYQATQHSGAVWIDLYDDWTVAPDINPWHRYLAGRTYRAIASGRETRALITCNSVYMAAKLGLPASHIVPNGVDECLASLPLAGDVRSRLVILGHLFGGRTDKGLLREALMDWHFDEVVLGAPGADPDVISMIEQAKAAGRPLRVESWISHDELARIAGPRTVALIPHITSDYTLSQDLMKVYQFIALGIKVICPRLLWPSALSDKFAYLHGIGSDCQSMMDWNNSFSLSSADRASFVESHSWSDRVGKVRRLLLDRSNGA